jgi:hypothetical protein
MAAEDLGAKLARRGCRILVFSNEASFIESDIVRDYLATNVKKEPKVIQVRYPPQLHKLFPGEPDHESCSIVNRRVLNGRSLSTLCWPLPMVVFSSAANLQISL